MPHGGKVDHLQIVSMPRYTYEEIDGHKKSGDLWLVVEGKVYDLSGFVEEHPGGSGVLLEQGRRDASKEFERVGHSSEARELMKRYEIGGVEDGPKMSFWNAVVPIVLSVIVSAFVAHMLWVMEDPSVPSPFTTSEN